MSEAIRKALDKAIQLATVASDWNLEEVEIDGEMVSIYDVRKEFKAALAELGSQDSDTVDGKVENE